MITPEQIRAARALLGWSQQNLAQQCQISTTSINNIERGEVQPRTSTLETIKTQFLAQGIIFSGSYGVDIQKNVFNVQVWEGHESIARYLDDVVNTVKGTNEIPLHFNFDDRLWVKQGHTDAYHTFFENMIRYGIRERVLVCEGNTVRYAPYKTSEYRWFSQELSGQIGYSLYGNKYAIFVLGKANRVIIIESPMIVEVYKQQFQSMWNIAQTPPKVVPLFNTYKKS